MKNIIPKGNKILLCCGKSGCPSIEKAKKGMYKIKDDHGGSVLLDKDHLSAIREALAALDR